MPTRQTITVREDVAALAAFLEELYTCADDNRLTGHEPWDTFRVRIEWDGIHWVVVSDESPDTPSHHTAEGHGPSLATAVQRCMEHMG